VKAAWDWALPRDTETEQRAVVEFADELGFDTLIVNNTTAAMHERGRELDVSIVEIVSSPVPESFVADHPDAVQTLQPFEQELVDVLSDAPGRYQRMAHRWFPLLHGGDWLCFEHSASMSYLEDQVSDALRTADGVALDAVGFRNHYACFCAACEARRERGVERTEDHEWEVLGRVAENQLVEAVDQLSEHATAEQSDAIVANHVWPRFNPNPAYGHRLPLDYCSQTIAWFYRPNWSIERVEFEAATHARLAGAANDFVPFVGMLDEAFLRRPPERLRRELEIGLEYGDGNLVLGTLGVPANHPEYADVIEDVLG